MFMNVHYGLFTAPFADTTPFQAQKQELRLPGTRYKWLVLTVINQLLCYTVIILRFCRLIVPGMLSFGS